MMKFIIKTLIVSLLTMPVSQSGIHISEVARYKKFKNDTDSVHIISESLYPILTDAINIGIDSICNKEITLIQYPSQGSLKWCYQNINGIFNKGTFDYVSARVKPSEDSKYLASLSPPGSFPNAYSQLLKTIYYNASGLEQLEDSIYEGRWVLNQLDNNTCHPSKTNGGMKTVNPNTGSISDTYQVAYTISNSIHQLEQELRIDRKSIKIEIKVDNPSPIKIQIVVSHEKTDTILYNLPDSLTSVLLPFNAGSMENGTIRLEYYGVAMFNINPKKWESDSNTGWYYGYPIANAVRNTDPNNKGYHFIIKPDYNFGSFEEGGDFGFITNLLICDSIVGIFSDSEESILKKNRNAFAPSNIIFEKRNSNENVITNLKKTIFPRLRVPILEQTATVIGGTFCFPGAEK